MKNIRYWEFIEEDNYGYKDVLCISEGDVIKHIYTIKNESPQLASKHPVHYKESISRTVSRTEQKGHVQFTELEPEQAISLASEATRDEIKLNAAKRIKYYENQKEEE